MLIKELPESNWGEFLMDFSKSNEGKTVKVSAEFKEGGVKTLGQNKLITFEGDCTGDVWERVKVAIGDMEGGSPDALYHTVTFPKSIVVEEKDNGTISKLSLEDDNGTKTLLEPVDTELTA